MMGLKEVGERLPPGYRFYPSDEELVCHYLYKKIANEESTNYSTLIDIDLHSCEPWQLPEVAKLSGSEWYFFTFRDRKYATGFRTNRATTSGYWKATGKDRPVFDPKTREIVGMRKTLVFYRNRAPNGIKTGWIMHEFRLESPPMPPKEDWVLCRVFHKSNRDTNITRMLELTGLSSILPLSNQHDNNEEHDHMGGTSQQQQIIPTSNNNYSNIIVDDVGNANVIVTSNNISKDGRHTNLNDNMSMSSSSSLNPSADLHHHNNNNNAGSSSFSISELMNDNEDDEFGFLGSIDLLEGTSKFGAGLW